MDIVKLIVITDRDIISILGRVVSENPLKIQLSSNCTDLLQSAIILMLQKFERNKISEANIELKSIEDDNMYVFDLISEFKSTNERNFHRIDYKGFFKVLSFDKDNRDEVEGLYARKSEKIKSAFANKIRQLLINDRVEDKHTLQYLLEIDGKIDRLLELLETNNEEIKNFIRVSAINISGGGLCFFSEKEFKKGQILYIEGKLDDIVNKPEFVAFIQIIRVVNTSKGFIYSASFNKTDAEFTENIIKYVFEKERKLIRGFKKK